MYSIFAAVGACIPWLAVRLLHSHVSHPGDAILPGLSIFGASWLICLAAEAAEVDLPQSVSIGLVALIAVLPEYAVDLYFAWTAGKNPIYTAYAAANMTGANRLLIGIGWPAVLFASWYRKGRSEIHLTTKNSVELLTLFAATLYSFLLSFHAALSPIDSLIFFLLFGFYAYLSSTAEMEEPELEGPARLIADLPALTRRLVIIGLFIFSAMTVYLSAAPFAEGILAVGRHFHMEEFILVQWLAPLASEAPEFIIAVIFALKGKAAAGLRALISSKVNQWTLLIGTLPLAYSLSLGRMTPMPMDARQVEELFLTSAQSLLGMVVLMDLRFGLKEAAALIVLFSAQIVFPSPLARYAFSGFYIAAACVMIFRQNRRANLSTLISHVLKP